MVSYFASYMLQLDALGFFDHGQKYTAESRCGDPNSVKILLRHNPSGGNFIKTEAGRREYFTTSIVYKEIFSIASPK